MLKNFAGGVLASFPGTVKREAWNEGQPRSCGLAWDKARSWAKRLSWQTQGGRVK